MRNAFLRLLTALVVIGLAGCGFQLRGTATYAFDSMYLSSAAKLTDSAAAAQVVLNIPVVQDDKEVLSLSSAGAVREFQLIKRVTFRLHDNDGADWMPAGEIVVRRSYTFNETQALARDLEEQRLQRDMQTDVIQQIVRRLQAARKPA